MEFDGRHVVAAFLLVLFVVFLVKYVHWNFSGESEDETPAPDTAPSSGSTKTTKPPQKTAPGFRLVGSPKHALERRARRWASLTLRERAVARLIIADKSNDEIARELGISRRTVEKHIERIYEKLGVHSRGAVPLADPGMSENPDMGFDDFEDTT